MISVAGQPIPSWAKFNEFKERSGTIVAATPDGLVPRLTERQQMAILMRQMSETKSTSSPKRRRRQPAAVVDETPIPNKKVVTKEVSDQEASSSSSSSSEDEMEESVSQVSVEGDNVMLIPDSSHVERLSILATISEQAYMEEEAEAKEFNAMAIEDVKQGMMVEVEAEQVEAVNEPVGSALVQNDLQVEEEAKMDISDGEDVKQRVLEDTAEEPCKNLDAAVVLEAIASAFATEAKPEIDPVAAEENVTEMELDTSEIASADRNDEFETMEETVMEPLAVMVNPVAALNDITQELKNEQGRCVIRGQIQRDKAAFHLALIKALPAVKASNPGTRQWWYPQRAAVKPSPATYQLTETDLNTLVPGLLTFRPTLQLPLGKWLTKARRMMAEEALDLFMDQGTRLTEFLDEMMKDQTRLMHVFKDGVMRMVNEPIVIGDEIRSNEVRQVALAQMALRIMDTILACESAYVSLKHYHMIYYDFVW